MGSLAEADTRELPEEVAAAMGKIPSLTGRFLRISKEFASLKEPEEGSRLARLDAMTTPFGTTELAIANLSVAIDNLHTFFRYLRKTRELPMLAHYGLFRSAVEATSYGLWVLDGKQQAAASRTLRMARQDQANASRLFSSLGAVVWDTSEMQKLVRERHEALRGIEQADLCKAVQATNTITAVDKKIEHRAGFTGLQVWRGTSGLTHGSSAAMIFLLERSPDGTRTSRMWLSVAFLEAAIENTEALLTRVGMQARAPRPKSNRNLSVPRRKGS